MNVIEVEIKNKKAVRTNETAYVCDNSDFTVVFSFDEEWDEFETKTARFAYNDKYQDVIFTGTECQMPIISDTKLISVGVFAGNLQTTTPAPIVANKSILCGAGVPDKPSENVYNQIVELCNEAVETAKDVEERANKGEFNGSDGEDGHTPVKGVDYWTEEDKSEIVKEVYDFMFDDVLLVDHTTNKNYTLYVSNGKLMFAESDLTSDEEGTPDKLSLVDKSTGQLYTLYVSNGKLILAESEV